MENKKGERRMKKARNKSSLSFAFSLTFFLSYLFSFLFLSCPSPFRTTSRLEAPEGFGIFSLSINAQRTIMPDAPALSEFAVFELIFHETTGGEDYTERFSAAASHTVTLAVGTYDITLNAYLEGPIATPTRLAASGTLTGIEIKSGAMVSETITLAILDSGGTGTFDWSVNITASGVTSAQMTIMQDGAHKGGSPIGDLRTTRSGSPTLDSGVYNVRFTLIKENNATGAKWEAVWDELLYIYGGLTSSFSITFDDDYFFRTHYTVTFDNGVTIDGPQSVEHGGTLADKTPNPRDYTPEAGLFSSVPDAYVFEGWYKGETPWDFDDPVYGDMTLTAKWSVPGLITTVAANNVEAAVAYVNVPANAGAYTLLVNLATPINTGPQTISAANTKLTMQGLGSSETTIQLSGAGPLFIINNATANLTLGENITLNGILAGASALARVTNGTLVMEDGSKITGHTNTSGNGGGVYVEGNGTFNMEGGTVSGNSAGTGGGVYVAGGTFIVGGTANVSGNIVSPADTTKSNVYLADGSYITLGTGGNGAPVPADGMQVWVQTATASGVIVQSGAAANGELYFRSDDDSRTVVHVGGSLVLTDITPGLAYELISTDNASPAGANLNTYRVRKGAVASGAVVIPATHSCNGTTGCSDAHPTELPVTEIGSATDTTGNGAFADTTITGVTIPASVTTIGAYAFTGCIGLTGITIPANVTTIGMGAFDGCASLTDITINTDKITSFRGTTITTNTFSTNSNNNWITLFPATGLNVTFNANIGNYAFYVSGGDNLYRLTSVTISDSVESIGSYAFYQCTRFASVTIGSGVTTIRMCAFAWCSGFPGSITIPANVTTIGSYAFRYCKELTSVIFEGDAINTFSDNAFPEGASQGEGGNVLRTAYQDPVNGGAGTYTRSSGGNDWTKEGVSTPTAADYDIGNLEQVMGSVTAVTITRRTDRPTSTGAVSNIRYDNSPTLPTDAGIYAVTFDVAAVTGWYAASGLSAGTLTVNPPTPVASDYDIGNLTQTVGSITAVEITPKTGKSGGDITLIYYDGAPVLPTTIGTYTVTFDVDADLPNWSAATGLPAGTLSVVAQNHFLIVPGDYSWTEAVSLIDGGGANQTWVINVTDEITIASSTSNTFPPTGLTVTLIGSGSITLSSNGSLLRIGANQTIIMNDLTLVGRIDNTASLVNINGGMFNMNSGKISGNTTTGSGGGVYVTGASATFTMYNGEVSGNRATTSNGGGGGVYVTSSGTFTMEGGAVSDNTVINSASVYGGGVYVAGIFTMSGGEVSGNEAPSGGGGVHITNGGTFIMQGNAKVTGNTATRSETGYGGGVFVGGSATFTMEGGTVSGNTANIGGGGVNVQGTFTMEGGEVSGNRATNNGGGVHLLGNGYASTFTMKGGAVSGNTAGSGGGVYVGSNPATFHIVTGTIYGRDEGALSNTSSSGAALYVYTGNSLGVAQYGTFVSGTWVKTTDGNLNGDLSTRNETIRVANGALQP